MSWVLLNESSSLTLNSLSNQTYEWHHLCIQWRKFILQKIYVNNQIGRYAVHFAVHYRTLSKNIVQQTKIITIKQTNKQQKDGQTEKCKKVCNITQSQLFNITPNTVFKAKYFVIKLFNDCTIFFIPIYNEYRKMNQEAKKIRGSKCMSFSGSKKSNIPILHNYKARNSRHQSNCAGLTPGSPMLLLTAQGAGRGS